MKASVMLERDRQWAVILAFDVKVERDAATLAEELGVRIFTARIIYHLFDALQKYRDELRDSKKSEFRSQAVFPCRLRVLPQFIFRDRDPIIFGVVVDAGVLVSGTPLCVVTVPRDKEGQPTASAQKEVIELGRVASIEFNHKSVDRAVKGQEVCIKIDAIPGEPPRQFGRHFDDKDDVLSRVSRESIDVLKEYFRDEMKNSDWQVVIELKKMLSIL
jgi:translation initiation factor 5B